MGYYHLDMQGIPHPHPSLPLEGEGALCASRQDVPILTFPLKVKEFFQGVFVAKSHRRSFAHALPGMARLIQSQLRTALHDTESRRRRGGDSLRRRCLHDAAADDV